MERLDATGPPSGVAAVAKTTYTVAQYAYRRVVSWWWRYWPSPEQVQSLVALDTRDYESAASGWALTKKWGARAKAHFGYVHERTRAAEGAVQAWLSKAMAAENVRIKDRLAIMPWAIQAVFTPSQADIAASRMERCTRHLKRKYAAPKK